MRIVGRLGSTGRPVVGFELAHGDDPGRALARRGWATVRPLLARRTCDGTGELELVVEVHATEPRAESERRVRIRRETGVPAGAIPVVHQRIAAYALVTSARGLLATEFSDRTSAEGRWGLAGGGIDPGEEPTEAVLREVVEESSQHVVVGELAKVDSNRWIGPNPAGVVEDYHAVRLIYRAHCPEPSDPVVLDVGGTTASARWVDPAAWAELPWSSGWRRIVADLLDHG